MPPRIDSARIARVGYVCTDGGRRRAGFFGNSAGDCVVRAIAIAAELDYREVYEELFRRNKLYAASKPGGKSRRAAGQRANVKGKESPRHGVYQDVFGPWLEELGFERRDPIACRTFVDDPELAWGRHVVVQVQNHAVAVIEGVYYDKWDSRFPTKRNDGTNIVQLWSRY